MSCRNFSKAAVFATTTALSSAAMAHHPTGGMAPATAWHGFLSGLGHPVLGPDHLAFVVGLGLLAGIAGFGPLLPALFVAAMTAGLGLHVAGVGIPMAELLVAGSVVLVGMAVWRHRAGPGTWLEGGLFALAGLVHGHAFAEAVIGAEPTPIFAYIVGLAAMQMTIALGAFMLGQHSADGNRRLTPARVRIMGAAIFAIGLALIATGSGLIA